VFVVVLDVLDAALDLELSMIAEVGDTPVGPDPDQAAVDAEFAAIVLAEAPWCASEPAPVPAPPRAASATGPAPRPRRPSPLRDGAGPHRRGAGPRAPRRRPGSVARSPPPTG
jgi:hypothetical protein